VTHDQDEALSLADRIVLLKDGRVQQIGTPQEVYAQPANLEVARFMGYRNVLDLDVARIDGDRVALRGVDMTLDGTLKQAPGAKAAAAIRPEEILVATGGEGGNTIDAVIAHVEYGGRESLLDVKTASGHRLWVRSHAQVVAGEAVKLHIPPERVLVYPSDAVAAAAA
jgi:putative spermidine/putrescine transport system ATP-binding protein